MKTLILLLLLGLPEFGEPSNHPNVYLWTGTGTKVDGKVLVHWRLSNGKEVIRTAIGLYLRDDNGNLHGAWEYRDKLTAKELSAIERGELGPLETRNMQYIQKGELNYDATRSR